MDGQYFPSALRLIHWIISLDYSRDVNNPPLRGRDLVALQRETWQPRLFAAISGEHHGSGAISCARVINHQLVKADELIRLAGKMLILSPSYSPPTQGRRCPDYYYYETISKSKNATGSKKNEI